MNVVQFVLVLLAAFVVAEAQRPFYAGSRPIGYPEVESNPLANRFGEDEGPIEARGDGNLINRFNQMPIDNRPFWYINWQAYDDLRRRQPQTWPLSQNGFINRF